MDDSIVQRLSNVALREDEGGCLTLADEDITNSLKEDDLSVLARRHGVKLQIWKGLKPPWEELGGVVLSRCKNWMIIATNYSLDQ